MSQRASGRADTVERAVEDAVAELVGASPRKVRVRIDGADLGGLTGPFHVELSASGVAPTEDAPAAEEAVEASRPVESAGDAADEPETGISPEDLDAEADAAADFLEGLLDAMDLPGDLKIRVLDDRAEVEMTEMGNGALIGRRGQTLDAVQELVRSALQRQFERRSRVLIDAEGYRTRRLEKLLEKAEDAIDEVLDSGEAVRLEPMDVFERKAVHQLVAEVDGVVSRSQGREPGRRVVIEAAD